MSLQTLTLKLDGITAGDYLTWCRDPEPPALDTALRSIALEADPLSDTITAILDWKEPPPAAPTAAIAAGLPLAGGAQVDQLLTDGASVHAEDHDTWTTGGSPTLPAASTARIAA